MRQMLETKHRIPCIFFVFGLVISLLFVSTVSAQISVDIEGGAATIYVNQQVEYTANATGGIPPYSYQWYTQLWSQDPNTPTASPIGNLVGVSGANSPSFNFTATSPGIYDISIRVNDSANNSVYDSFPPAGIEIKVLAATTPGPSQASSSPAVAELPFFAVLPLLIVVLSVAPLIKRKLNN